MPLRKIVIRHSGVLLMFAALLPACAVWWGGGIPAMAADGTPPMTLKECVETALAQSPAMMSSDEAVKGAEWQKKKAFTGFLPTFSTTYTYTRLDEAPTSTIMGVTVEVGSTDNYKWEAEIAQPLFTGFALTAAYELSKLGLDTAEISRMQTRMDVILRVKQVYFGLLEAEKSLDVAQQSVKQLEAQLDVARNFFEVGMVPKNHVLQAEVKLAEARQRETVAEHRRRYAQASLNTLLRRDIEAPLQVLDILTYKPYQKALDEAIEASLKSRPEIQAGERLIAIKEQSVRAAKADYYPSLAVVYNYAKAGDTADVSGSPYHDENAWYVAAKASWNFWEWGRTRDQVQTSRTEVNQARHSLTQITDAVRLEVKENYLNMQAAEKNIVVAKKAVESAEENYRMNVERYREQVATSTEVIDAQTLLTSALTNYYGALYQFNLSVATLERAMGLENY